ncbi:hypothetical protein NA57DRAFT_58172 [Rhizodiscina lignyota]|uniref:Uncharacterized protein n=1 Tax=Rhizodiscina lignyota TaxID=1504668 RepID=A0A9P4M9A6_9PEZI|nr:hypothetical protein NA57DRAFT_58172 [Rhizodiscina lignyota]
MPNSELPLSEVMKEHVSFEYFVDDDLGGVDTFLNLVRFLYEFYFLRLCFAKLSLNPNKSIFFTSTLKVLDWHRGPEGLRPTVDKHSALLPPANRILQVDEILQGTTANHNQNDGGGAGSDVIPSSTQLPSFAWRGSNQSMTDDSDPSSSSDEQSTDDDEPDREIDRKHYEKLLKRLGSSRKAVKTATAIAKRFRGFPSVQVADNLIIPSIVPTAIVCIRCWIPIAVSALPVNQVPAGVMGTGMTVISVMRTSSAPKVATREEDGSFFFKAARNVERTAAIFSKDFSPKPSAVYGVILIKVQTANFPIPASRYSDFYNHPSDNVNLKNDLSDSIRTTEFIKSKLQESYASGVPGVLLSSAWNGFTCDIHRLQDFLISVKVPFYLACVFDGAQLGFAGNLLFKRGAESRATWAIIPSTLLLKCISRYLGDTPEDWNDTKRQGDVRGVMQVVQKLQEMQSWKDGASRRRTVESKSRIDRIDTVEDSEDTPQPAIRRSRQTRVQRNRWQDD